MRDNVVVVVILLLLNKSPGLGLGGMDEQAPAFSARGDIHAMKNITGYKVETARPQPAAVQCVIGPGIEHACLLVGATQH